MPLIADTRGSMMRLAAVLAVAASIAVAACSGTGASAAPAGSGSQLRPSASAVGSVSPAEDFVIHVLHERWDDYTPRMYTVDESWPFLSTVDLSHDLWDVRSSEIETYDWSNQVIALTKEASTRLIATAEATNSDSSFGARFFVVTLGDRRLYGGRFILPESSAGISFPVMYLKSSDVVSFLVRPSHYMPKD